jgi:lysophospholipase L1-like esterase
MRRGGLILVPVAVVLLATGLPAHGARGGSPRFGAYLSCTPAGRDHDSACMLGARAVAVFRSFRRGGVRYEVCVRRPGGHRHCTHARTRGKGVRSRTALALRRPGRYRISWLVHGARVKRVRLRARAPRVFVDGDSLAVGTKPYLPRELSGWPIRQSASISRHAPQGVALLRSMGRRLARIVVMQLGTNDDPRAIDSFRHAVRATMHVAGARRCVVWPNIVRPRVAGTSYAGYNAVLAAENRRRDNLFVVDWARMARRHRYWFGPDGVHPSATGYEARAAAIAAKVRACIGLGGR